LLANNADVTEKDDYGRTALMFASFHGHTDIVNALISGGAKGNSKPDITESKIMYASLVCDRD
jgi:ankyrin repeat protein